MAIVFLVVAYGIRRRIAWHAYGGALFIAALVGTVVAAMVRSRSLIIPWGTAAVPLGLLGLCGLLLYLAGRAIAEPQPRGSRSIWITLAAVVFLLPQVLRPYVMPSGSMEDSILIGDHILARPLLGTTPSRGDVVAMRYPVDRNQVFVKRIVAIGGDRVRFSKGTLILNGSPVNEPYASHKASYPDEFRDNFPAAEPEVTMFTRAGWGEWLKQNATGGELLVPQGKFFVLGDNRDNSLDSRYWGFLEQSDVIGKPVLVYFSVNLPESLRNTPVSPPVLLHPSWIRWNRIFKML
jgi:signal peptidase I